MSLASMSRKKLLLAIAALYAFGSLTFSLRQSRAMTETTTTIAGNHPDIAMTPRWRGADIGRPLQMTVVLALRNKGELRDLKVQLQQPGSANYHKWLSTAEFMRRFGPTQNQMDDVVTWLKANRFTVHKVSLGTRTIRFGGTVAQAERAFSTQIVSNKTVYANLSDPQVPASICGSIVAILGLSGQLESSPPKARSVGDAQAFSPDARINGKKHFGPQDFWTFYDEIPPVTPGSNGGTGRGDCIGLLESQTVERGALSLFAHRFGLPPVTLTVLPTDPGEPAPFATANEPYLDVEWAHAVAPNTPIALYLANDVDSHQSQLDALSLAVFQNACGAISSSIHDDNKACPDLSLIAVYNNEYSEAVAKGMTIFHASGDFGSYFDCGQPGMAPGATSIQPSIDESAASGDVTVVGGTQFVPSYNSTGADTSVIGPGVEYVWNMWETPVMPVPSPDAAPTKGASTGGISVVIPKPVWQATIVPVGVKPEDFTMRGVPDVSAAAASDKPGVWIVTTKATMSCGTKSLCFTGTGGTSDASPMWAGISRLLAQKNNTTRLGNINPRLYDLAAAGSGGLVDVTNDGSNCPFSDCGAFPGYKVGKGYDLGTGLGSPDIDVLLADF